MEFSEIVELIWKCKTQQEVINMCKKPSDVIPFLEVWEHRTIHNENEVYKFMNSIELTPSQELWWKNLKNQNDRQILWIFDSECKNTKEKYMFCRWLRIIHKAQIMMLTNGVTVFEFNGAEYVCVDVDDDVDKCDLYTTIQDLKDGYLCNKDKILPPQKVIVFASFFPETKSLSRDKWMIVVQENGNVETLLDGSKGEIKYCIQNKDLQET